MSPEWKMHGRGSNGAVGSGMQSWPAPHICCFGGAGSKHARVVSFHANFRMVDVG